MSSEIGSPLLVSVDDDCGEIRKAFVLGGLGNCGEFKLHISRSCVVRENDDNELLSDVEEKSPSVEMMKPVIKSEVSPSPTRTRKGYGLKTWRRIKRDVSKVGESSVDSGKMVMQELSSSIMHPNKRSQVYAGRHQKIEDSVSSTNHVDGRLDVFNLLGDRGRVMGPSVDAGKDLENIEDSSIKSLTAASFSGINYEMPNVVGTPAEKTRMKSLSGKNLTYSVKRGQGKGEQARIEKEDSLSSIESDSRSSNFVFVQGSYATSNGIQSDRPVHCDGENEDELQGSEQKVMNGLPGGYGREKEGAHEDILPKHSSVEIQNEKREKLVSSSDQDPLVESTFVLKNAQESLEKELLKFKDISEPTSIKYSVLDTQPEVADIRAKFQETRQLPSSEGVQYFPPTVQSEMVDRDVQSELEHLFMQRIEAEVEYVVISRMVQNLRVGAVLEQTQILLKCGDKAVMLKKESRKRENCEDIASADETLKQQKRVCMNTSYSFILLLLLLLILGVFIFQFSPDYVEVVPT